MIFLAINHIQLYEKKKQLRVGLAFNDELFPVTPACKRAVTRAKAALEARGHTVNKVNIATNKWTRLVLTRKHDRAQRRPFKSVDLFWFQSPWRSICLS